jgi:hypothetical protein
MTWALPPLEIDGEFLQAGSGLQAELSLGAREHPNSPRASDRLPSARCSGVRDRACPASAYLAETHRPSTPEYPSRQRRGQTQSRVVGRWALGDSRLGAVKGARRASRGGPLTAPVRRRDHHGMGAGSHPAPWSPPGSPVSTVRLRPLVYGVAVRMARVCGSGADPEAVPSQAPVADTAASTDRRTWERKPRGGGTQPSNPQRSCSRCQGGFDGPPKAPAAASPKFQIDQGEHVPRRRGRRLFT